MLLSRTAAHLGGVDVFLLRGHQEMGSQGLPGNTCAIVLELGGKLEAGRVHARVAHAMQQIPELSWTLGRDLKLQAVWRHNGARTVQRVQTLQLGARWEGSDALLDPVLAGLDRVGSKRLWCIELLRGIERDAIVLRWFHPFGDARGMARFLAWLGGDEPAPAADSRYLVGDSKLARLGKEERFELSRAYIEHVNTLASRPIASIYGASNPLRPGATRAVRLRLDRGDTERFRSSVRRRAKLADTSLIVWAATRLLDRALGARGLSPPHHVVPLPVSLDRKGEQTRLFGNNLTMTMVSLDRAALADEAVAVTSLAQQQRDAIRRRIDLGMLAALDRARVLPGPIYNWLSRMPFGGERTSLVVSNPGAIEVSRFLGVDVVDAYPVPSAMAPPGFQVIATQHEGRMSLVVVFVEGAIDVDEVRALLPGLRQDLLGEE